MRRKERLSCETEHDIFASRLREIMERRGTNQTKLSAFIKESQGEVMQRQTISQYMNGQSKPDADRLVMLCKALDVSSDWLIGLSDTQSTNTEIRAICEYTGLGELAVNNLCIESGDRECIFALSEVLGYNYCQFHKINRFILMAMQRGKKTAATGRMSRSIVDYVPEEKRSDFFSNIEEWGGELLHPHDAVKFYASQAAHELQLIVEAIASRQTRSECYNTAGEGELKTSITDGAENGNSEKC